MWRSTTATCNCQVSYGDRSRLFRLAAVLGSWKTSFAHFLTRLEKTSPSVQCVAKYRRSQMSIPKSGRPHMAGLLRVQKVRWQNVLLLYRTVYYCKDERLRVIKLKEWWNVTLEVLFVLFIPLRKCCIAVCLMIVYVKSPVILQPMFLRFCASVYRLPANQLYAADKFL